MVEVQKTQEQLSARTSCTSPLLRVLRPRHTTTMDGGSAENAGAAFCPYILYIAALARPAPAAYRTSCTYKKGSCKIAAFYYTLLNRPSNNESK